MALFKKQAPSTAVHVPRLFTVGYSESRPAWLHDGMPLSLIEGYETLEVVGELRYQEVLWRNVGGRVSPDAHVRMDIHAVLIPETGNPYDDNAVSVWIGGLKVGYLSRDNAARYRPGIIELQCEHGQPVALAGVITGGGVRHDGPGRLGVFLDHDPEAFGLAPAYAAPYADARLVAALTQELAVQKGCSYGLTWMHGLAADDVRAIQALRKALAAEANPIGRYFIYSELEAALYRCRDVFASALDEYDPSFINLVRSAAGAGDRVEGVAEVVG
jgi:hypothetical protein